MRCGDGVVHGLLARAARDHPDAVAVRDRRGDLTHADLWALGSDAAARLVARGVRPRDRVLLRLANSREFVVLLQAVLRVGAVAVPVSPAREAPQVVGIVVDCEPALCVVEAGDTALGRDGVQVVEVAELLSAAAGSLELEEPDVAADDVAFLVYTSGSTAAPKGVVCPHERVVFAARAIAERVGYRGDDLVYGRLPFSFDYGLYQILLTALAGAALVLPGDSPDVLALNQIRSFGVTVVPVVPPLAALLALAALRDRGPTRVRRFTNTGAELTAEHARRLRKAFPGADVLTMYGMTECKRVTISGPDDELRRPGSVGTPLRGTSVVVVGEGGAPAAPGSIGEIVVRGPHVMAGYWRAPEETARRYRPDRATGGTALHTGDYGWIDEAGDLHLVGRRDDILKRRGVRISTTEVEAAALAVPGVVEAAVSDVPGQGLLLWFTGAVDVEGVRSGMAALLDAARLPDRVLRCDELPRTVHGKVDKRALAEHAAQTG